MNSSSDNDNEERLKAFKELAGRDRLEGREHESTTTAMPTTMVQINRSLILDRRIQKLTERMEARDKDTGIIQKDLAKAQSESLALKNQLAKSTEDVGRLDGQVKNDKLQAIQILALFVAFFTFVSVEFQLFSNVKDSLTFFALTAVLLAGLILFVCLTFLGLAYYHDTGASGGSALRFNKRFLVILSVAALLLLGLGVSLSMFAYQDKASSCTVLKAEVMAELNHQDSKVVDFLKDTYARQCED